MKKLAVLSLLAFSSLLASADTITNYVYVVSNLYFREVHEITNNVKNTHYNYYFTNNVSTIQNVYQVTYKTNVTYNVDVSNEAVARAASEADRAERAATNALSSVEAAATSATRAGQSASQAAASATSAATSAQNAANAANNGINTINARINWFDQHSGERITQVNITTNLNITIGADEYHYTYTDHNGNIYNYIDVHPYRANGMLTLSPRTSGQFVSTEFIAWPTTRTGGYWTFKAAYVDSDLNGMRIQYVPTEIKELGYTDGNGAYPTGKQIPEYFYWQNGYIYFKVNVWVGGQVVGWCKSSYRYDNYPTPVNYQASNGQTMTIQNRSAYGSGSPTYLAVFQTSARTSSAGYTIQIPGSPSAADVPIIDWMRTGPFESDVEDRVAAVETSVSTSLGTFGTRLTTVETSVSTSIASFDSRLAAIEGGNPHAYVSPSGTTYANITYYETPVANGKVSVGTVGNFYPSTAYRFYLNFGGNPSANYWTFEPAYVDSDINGMRLHYLPKEQKTYTYSSYDSGCVYVPRDFYWQDGAIYMVVESYSGTTWKGSLRMKYSNTGNYQYPNGINHTSADTTASYYVHLMFDSREGTIMGTASGQWQAGHMKTANGKYIANYDGVIWFPAELTAEQRVIADWLATFHR